MHFSSSLNNEIKIKMYGVPFHAQINELIKDTGMVTHLCKICIFVWCSGSCTNKINS